MTSYFADAAEDLHDVPAGELYVRFLGWLRSQPGAGTDGGGATNAGRRRSPER
jgi:hypothetical protein